MVLLGILVGPGEDDIGVGVTGVGDEDLGAVEDPLVTLTDRRGPGAAGVGPGRGLGQAEGAKGRALGQRDEVFHLLLFGAEQVDRVGTEGQVGREGDTGRAADPRQFLDGDGVADVVGAGAAVFLGEDDAGEAEFAQAIEHQGAVEMLLLVALGGRGGDLGLGELAYHVTEQVLFFGQFKFHGNTPVGWYSALPPGGMALVLLSQLQDRVHAFGA